MMKLNYLMGCLLTGIAACAISRMTIALAASEAPGQSELDQAIMRAVQTPKEIEPPSESQNGPLTSRAPAQQMTAPKDFLPAQTQPFSRRSNPFRSAPGAYPRLGK